MVTFSNSIDSTIGASISGATNTLTIQNPSNTASSQAQELITVGGGTAGDVWTQYSIGSTNSWSAGVDNSDSDAYKITTAAAATISPSSGTELVRISTIGRYDFATVDNSINSQFIFGGTLDARIGMLLANNSTNAAANVVNGIVVAAGGAADPWTEWGIVSGQFWSAGLDNSDSDAFVISSNEGLGTNNVMRSSTAGEITFPLTPAFMAYLASNDTNVTGAGTTYNVGTNVAWTEVFDQNSDFNTNGTFTAPVTGRYYLEFAVNTTQLAATNTTGYIGIVTSNRTKNSFFMNWGVIRSVAVVADALAVTMSFFCDMDAADTAIFQITVAGGAGDTVDLSGGANAATSVAGFLQC